MSANSKTAGVIVIGNEILSGRTQDLTVSHIDKKLEELGIGRPSTYASIISVISTRGYV